MTDNEEDIIKSHVHYFSKKTLCRGCKTDITDGFSEDGIYCFNCYDEEEELM